MLPLGRRFIRWVLITLAFVLPAVVFGFAALSGFELVALLLLPGIILLVLHWRVPGLKARRWPAAALLTTLILGEWF